MEAIHFSPVAPFSSSPSVDAVSAWVYTHVLPPTNGGAARTFVVGTLEIDVDAAGIVRGLDIAHDMRRRTDSIEMPNADDTYWQMRIESDLEERDGTQVYDPSKRILAVKFDDDAARRKSFRLSKEVTVTCSASHILAIYVQNVTFAPEKTSPPLAP
jgi:hypothetical protein